MGAVAAWALVFGSSAAVLIIEITALRLLAPYLGLTLETSTLVIGIALAAIAFGSWGGGRLADRVDPRRVLGQTLGGSGVVVAFTPVAVRAAGEWAPAALMLVASMTILLPGALLSAVTPMVTKLRLTRLDHTGAVVGSLSGVASVGAIAGTVLTGFVLLSRVPVSAILVGLGMLLVVAGVLCEWRIHTWTACNTAGLTVAVLIGGFTAYVAPGACDVETKYHCVGIAADPQRATGRALILDGLRHSYVDVENPKVLQFAYVRSIAAGVDAAFPGSEPLQAYHLGGGGLTYPRYLAATRPGTQSLISEIDGGVVQIDRDELGLSSELGIEVRIEDGRLGLRRLPTGSMDLIVGDAFGGVSVPWHLTTVQTMRDVQRVLNRTGVYIANLIDHGGLAFVRAEVATLLTVFDNVVLLAESRDLKGVPTLEPDGGNFVVLASDRPIDGTAVQNGLDIRSTAWTSMSDSDLNTWVGEAKQLTDDYAPVDQLLEPNPPER
ncbi:spermidine synthase [Mycolicibacterium cosmeticum]|nr:spermidine synthase [Mycolicibacterium cosmeticum]